LRVEDGEFQGGAGLGDFAEQGFGDFLVGWVVGEVDGDEELFGFGIDIADVDTSFVSEEDPVTL